MLTFNVPELSPTAGQSADGVVLGSVAETLLTAAYQTIERCPGPVIYRLDRSGSSLNILNETSLAVATGTNSWYPFGNATFSDGDEFLLACDEGIKGILIRIDTAGNHSAALSVYDSTNGIWADNLLAVTDGTAAFENSGWRQILIPANAGRVAWRPSPDPVLNIPSKPYIRFRLSGVVGGNTPPACSNLVPIRETFRWEDNTATANGDTAVAPSADTHYPWEGSIWTWGFANKAYGAEVYMHLVGTDVIIDAHEYLATDGTWKLLTGWVNGTNDFTNGPAVLGNPVQKFQIRWDMPSDWTLKPQTFTQDNGTQVSVSAFWIRERVTGVTVYGPLQQARYRLRARQFGNANTNGVSMVAAFTVAGVSILDATVPNTTISACQLVNMTTGESVSLSIPANPVFPVNLSITAMTVNAGERLGLVCNSGGTLRNAQFLLM